MKNPATFTRRSFMVMPLALLACKPSDILFEISGLTMGTTYNVVALDTTRKLDEATVRAAINTALADVNAKMSNWDAGSEISRINASQVSGAHNISADLAQVMDAASRVSHMSGGRFDTTAGPLIEAWGFGAPGGLSRPTEGVIEAALDRSGHGNTLRLGDGALTKTRADAQVYLAAIGKGYGADHVGRALEALGITDYLVEIGGDLYASGRNGEGMRWQIGVETPNAFDRGVMDVIPVSGMGLATSGDYRNYFEEDGIRYSHVLDPVTGYPITHKTASATVLAENAMMADAWATAMLTLGRERGLEVANEQNLAVLFVDRDSASGANTFRTQTSEAFKALTA